MLKSGADCLEKIHQLEKQVCESLNNASNPTHFFSSTAQVPALWERTDITVFHPEESVQVT